MVHSDFTQSVCKNHEVVKLGSSGLLRCGGWLQVVDIWITHRMEEFPLGEIIHIKPETLAISTSKQSSSGFASGRGEGEAWDLSKFLLFTYWAYFATTHLHYVCINYCKIWLLLTMHVIVLLVWRIVFWVFKRCIWVGN